MTKSRGIGRGGARPGAGRKRKHDYWDHKTGRWTLVTKRAPGNPTGANQHTKEDGAGNVDNVNDSEIESRATRSDFDFNQFFKITCHLVI
jgi:hypothetical protein